jgi:hypothetical protein
MACFDVAAEIAMGCGEQPDVDRRGTRRTDGHDLAFLQHAE